VVGISFKTFTKICYIGGVFVLFQVVVSLLDIFVRAIISVFAGIRTMIVGIFDMIPGSDLFVAGLDSVIDVSLIADNIAIILSIISVLFSIWGMMKILHLIRG
jgi:hypothetical protein